MSLCLYCLRGFCDGRPWGEFTEDPIIPEHNKVEALFRECGAKARVRVLHDRTVEGLRTVHIVCIERMRKSPIHGELPKGPFEVWNLVSHEHCVGWVLELDEQHD